MPELSSLLTLARQHTALIILGLDCNGHSEWWGPPDTITNSTGALVEDFILQERLAVENQWPCPPTFHSEQGFQSWIDLTLTTPSLSPSVTDWYVLSDVPLDSDHSALTYTVNLEPTRAVETRLDWRHVNWDSFRSTLQTTLHTHFPDARSIDSPSCLEAFVTDLTTTLHSVIDIQVPRKRVCSRSHAWWSSHLDTLRTEHQRARRRWKRTHNREDKRHANACKRKLHQAIIEAKRNCWRQFCEDTTPADMWTAFKKVSHPPFCHRILPLVHEGNTYLDAHDQSHILAERFFPSNVTPETTFHRQITLEVSELLQQARSASYQPITIQELHSAIHASGPWKSPGLDNISNICLRQCEPLLAPLLIQLFMASLNLD